MLLLEPVSSRLLPLSELVVPLVPVGLCDVSPAPPDPIDTSVSTNPDPAIDADELDSEPEVAVEEPLPLVPVVLP